MLWKLRRAAEAQAILTSHETLGRLRGEGQSSRQKDQQGQRHRGTAELAFRTAAHSKEVLFQNTPNTL